MEWSIEKYRFNMVDDGFCHVNNDSIFCMRLENNEVLRGLEDHGDGWT